MPTRRMKKQSAPPPKLPGILACFFFSGAAGLIYQVAWAKALGLIFGHTTYAVATVLAVFMAGLTAGSAYLGRLAGQHARPVALYARIEFLVALTAALSIAGLAAVRTLYVAAYPAAAGSEPLLLAVRFLGTMVVLFIPTFLMGGTFPILVSSVAKDSAQTGIRVSQLYWVNTLGAAAGTLISGFALLPAYGLRLTIVSGVAINIVAGLIALRIAKETGIAPGVAPSRTTSADQESRKSTSRFLLFLFAIAGCTAFAYEIAWTRLLAITLGSSTYAFTLMLATFLAGTVIGSVLFQRFAAGSTRISIATLSRTQLGLGMGAVLSLVLFRWIPAVVPLLLRMTEQTFGSKIKLQCPTPGSHLKLRRWRPVRLGM